nr:hypothetical transcript [Hymenolepis microstoma]
MHNLVFCYVSIRAAITLRGIDPVLTRRDDLIPLGHIYAFIHCIYLHAYVHVAKPSESHTVCVVVSAQFDYACDESNCISSSLSVYLNKCKVDIGNFDLELELDWNKQLRVSRRNSQCDILDELLFADTMMALENCKITRERIFIHKIALTDAFKYTPYRMSQNMASKTETSLPVEGDERLGDKSGKLNSSIPGDNSAACKVEIAICGVIAYITLSVEIVEQFSL